MKLTSINKNLDTQVSFEIKLLNIAKEQGQKWQYYQIHLYNGQENYCFKSLNKETTSAVGTKAQIGKFAFVLEPINELENLKSGLKDFLDSSKKSFRFEPCDPSFELIIERIPEINKEKNFKIYLWIDSGNTKALEYTWDSIGVRFISSHQDLRLFVNY